MKRIQRKVLLAVTAIALCVASLAFVACGTFEGYDSDAAIIRGSSISEFGAAETTLLSKYTYSVGKLNGVKKIKNITVPENPVFDVTLSVSEGRMKAVLVRDNTVYLICEEETNEPVQMTLPAGTYSLRLVGEDAGGSFTFVYDSYGADEA